MLLPATSGILGITIRPLLRSTASGSRVFLKMNRGCTDAPVAPARGLYTAHIIFMPI